MFQDPGCTILRLKSRFFSAQVPAEPLINYKSYEGLDEFQHEVVDHAVEYVSGEAHTNGLENFWSLLKRTLGGTYVSVEPFHLFRYLDEQAWRYNNRKMDDAYRFDIAIPSIVGKRITYKE